MAMHGAQACYHGQAQQQNYHAITDHYLIPRKRSMIARSISLSRRQVNNLVGRHTYHDLQACERQATRTLEAGRDRVSVYIDIHTRTPSD